MSDKYKSTMDTARLQQVSLNNGGIQQFVCKWDDTLLQMKKRPADDELMNLFTLQFGWHLPSLTSSTSSGSSGAIVTSTIR